MFLHNKYTKLFFLIKLFMCKKHKTMPCSCKSGSSTQQVTSVKQVAKKPIVKMSVTKPVKKRIVFGKPIGH